MQFETLLLNKVDGIATITLNRPEKRNAMNPQLHKEMTELLDILEYDDETKVVVITGAGNSFCAGQDLKEYFYNLDNQPQARAKAKKASRWRSDQLRLFPKPTIAAINGWCFGGGFTIVASCDIAIAAEEATFGLSEVNFGKLAGGLVTRAITDHLHPKDLLYHLLTGRAFDGKKAAEMKWVTYAVPKDQLMDEVMTLAKEFTTKNPLVLRAAKEAYHYGKAMDYEVASAWTKTKDSELSYLSGSSWKKGVEQFKKGEYKPGLGNYQFDK